MANEITVTASLSAYKAAVMTSSVGRSLTAKLFTMSGNYYVAPECILVGTSATAFPLNQITAPHWSWFYNLDASNYVQLQNGASGAVFARLYPGEFALLPLDNACVPYGVANSAAVLVEYAILSY